MCVYTHTYIHMDTIEYYSALNRHCAICNNINGPGGPDAKWDKTHRKEKTVWPHICRILKKSNAQ